MLRTPFDLPQVRPPSVPVPDLEVVAHPGDDDLASDSRVLRKRGRHHHTPLLVRLRLRRAGEEEPLHQAAFLAERVEPGEPLVHRPLPVLARVAVEAPVHAACKDNAPGKRFAKLGR